MSEHEGLSTYDRAEMNERIRNALGYMAPGKIANVFGVTPEYVDRIKSKTPYRRIKGLRDVVKNGNRR